MATTRQAQVARNFFELGGRFRQPTYPPKECELPNLRGIGVMAILFVLKAFGIERTQDAPNFAIADRAAHIGRGVTRAHCFFSPIRIREAPASRVILTGERCSPLFQA